MLSLLHIEDIAVISQAEIAFGEGFNVLTGETGAGKSIVVDAIGAAAVDENQAPADPITINSVTIETYQ